MPAVAGRSGPVLWRDRLRSTQDEARRLLVEGRPAPFAVATADQRAGRGRLGRAWTAAPGAALAVTCVHRTRLAPERRSWFPLATGLAVLRAVREAAGPAAEVLGLKWPNDLLDGRGRKLSGILAEAHGPDHVLLGAGVNLRGPVLDLAGQTVPGALALDELGPLRDGGGDERAEPPAAPALARSLARAVAEELDLLEAADGDAVASGQAARYRETCVTLGGRVRVTLPGAARDLVGVARDVDDCGRLLVTADGGDDRAVAAGDVHHVRPEGGASRGLDAGTDRHDGGGNGDMGAEGAR